MPTSTTLLAFAAVCVGVVLSPGPSNFFLLAHGISHGRSAAWAATGGIATASALRVVLAAVGLSAALAASAMAFEVVRWMGVAYLVFLGIKALRSHSDTQALEVSGQAQAPWSRSAWRGLLVGLGNPKMVLFFLALLPQFVRPDRGSQTSQIIVLGLVFWIIGTAWDVAYTAAATTLAGRWRAGGRPTRWLGKAEGLTYLTGGLGRRHGHPPRSELTPTAPQRGCRGPTP